MITTFKVILIIIILITFLGVIGERKDTELRKHLTAICIVSIVGFIVSSLVL